MSSEKYANVQEIFGSLIFKLGIQNKYKGLSDYLDIPYQTLMAWKKRNSIGDYSVFMDKGISRQWLQTMTGEIFATPAPDPDRIRLDRLWAKLNKKERDAVINLLETMKGERA